MAETEDQKAARVLADPKATPETVLSTARTLIASRRSTMYRIGHAVESLFAGKAVGDVYDDILIQIDNFEQTIKDFRSGKRTAVKGDKGWPALTRYAKKLLKKAYDSGEKTFLGTVTDRATYAKDTTVEAAGEAASYVADRAKDAAKAITPDYMTILLVGGLVLTYAIAKKSLSS